MAQLNEIINFIEEEFRLEEFVDASLNGLQIEGSASISLLASAVDCSIETVKQAIDRGAQALLVHHGVFWGKSLPLIGAHRELAKLCLAGDLSVIAVHLPLDAHPEFGNNFLIARALELTNLSAAIEYGEQDIGCLGSPTGTPTLSELAQSLKKASQVNFEPLVLPFGPSHPRRIAIVSGAAADALQAHQLHDFDTLITGEPRHSAYHYAKENGLNAIFAGHYASEVFGVKALGQELMRRFGVKHEFIDCPTGI